ncbi:MAG: hypothetical protein WCN95_00730 [bacterium]
MNKTRFVHAIPVDSLVAVMTACSFFAIWLLWPSTKGVPQTGGMSFQGTRYVFRSAPASNLRDPTALVRPLLGSGEIGREDFDDTEATTQDRTDLTKLMERSSGPGTSSLQLSLQDDPVARLTRAYVDTPVFVQAPAVTTTGLVRINVSAKLQVREFDTSVLVAATLPQHEQAWTIRAFVEVDEHGSVSHVFLETASASAELNEAVLRALYGSRSRKSELPSDGVLIISGAGLKPAASNP